MSIFAGISALKFVIVNCSNFLFCISLFVVFMVLTGCGTTQVQAPDVEPLAVDIMEPPPPPPLKPEAIHYKDIVHRLKKKGNRRGVDFYQNDTGNYVLYAIESKEKFTFADKTGTCLYNAEISKNVENALTNTKNYDVTLASGICGIKYPDASPDVLLLIDAMARDLLGSLMSRLDGGPWMWKCSDESFLKQTVLYQFPFEVLDGSEDLEKSISRISRKIHDPLDIAFGDVVFYRSQENQTKVGVYAGYGLIVSNQDCQHAGLHRLTGENNYRIYRILMGYAWTRYQANDPLFLKKYVADSPQ